MSGVFINYRTGDGGFAAALLARVLSARFGPERVFLASRSIPRGEDFVPHILGGLSRSSVLLAVIGSQWLSTSNGRGHLRLDDPADWVRIELAEAFRLGLRVIPIFLDNTRLLRETDLPPDIATLARRQYLRLNHRNDGYDLAQLLAALTELVPELVLSRVFSAPELPVRNLIPSAWLRAGYGIVPFADRSNERADLAAWIAAPESVSARLITGPAGQGKTRLAVQLCQELTWHGWLAGIVHDQAGIGDLADAGTIGKPMLFVVDNADAHLDQVRALAAALVERSTAAPPARLLLLSRGNDDGWLSGLRTHPRDRVRSLFHCLDERPLGSLAPTVSHRASEFSRAAAAFGRYLGRSAVDLVLPGELAHPRFAQARVLHATALISLLGAHRHDAAVPRPDPELLRAALPECPYRGLQPFQEQDARFFYGRDAQVRTLAEKVATQPVVMVIGGSGSGKSSLVRAGLLPLLRKQNVTAAVLRPTPGCAPRDLLARALRPIIGAVGLEPRDIPLLVDPIVAAVGELVLFVDQFEELIAADQMAARQLLDMVMTLVRAAPSRPAGAPAVRAVLTMRSADLDEILTSDTVALVQTVPVPRMGPAELRAAVTGPAETARVVSFEPGLVERIIVDAAAAPGQLPLVEFVLTRLWESQQGGTMTHQAYDRLGGVAGALAAYADEVYGVRLSEQRRAGVEPLLVQLARPGDGGAFTLSPTRLDQLTPESRELAAELARHRLVVIRHDPDHPEVVALAHEALTEQWPRLRGWLADARDFRAWQEQLRVTLTQWQQSNHDAGALLRGAPLGTAQDWLTREPPGLTADERTYITASRAHQRRAVRRWRVATALIAVLALVAGGFATVVTRQRQEKADQLRRAAAVALGQESLRRGGDMGVQFAQAAWKHNPDSPETYAALLDAYLGNAGVDDVRSDLWTASTNMIDISVDRSVTAVAAETGDVTIWTDLFRSSPRPWQVATVPDIKGMALSQDGRRLAIVDKRGGITLWDVEHRTGPFPLPARSITDPADNGTKNLRFAPDGGTLVATAIPDYRGYTTVTPDIVEVWDTVRRQPVRHGIQPAPDTTQISIKRVEPNGRSAWFDEYHSGDLLHYTVLRDLATGVVQREYHGNSHTLHETLMSCDRQSSGLHTLTVRHIASGAVRFTRIVPGCTGFIGATDLTGRYAVFHHEGTRSSFGLLYLIDLDTAQTYRLQVPPTQRNERAGFSTRYGLIAIPTGNGRLTVFGLTPKGLLRFHTTAPVDNDVEMYHAQFKDFLGPTAIAVSPDGRYLAAYLSSSNPAAGSAGDSLPGMQVFELDSQRRVVSLAGTALSALKLSRYPYLTFSTNGQRLFALGRSDELVVLSATDLTVQRRIPLPIPPLAPDDGADAWNTSIVPVSDDEVVVLRAGALTRWQVDSGEQLGTLLPLRADLRERRETALRAQAVSMPGQSGKVLVAMTDRVELWDLDRRQAVRHFRPRPEKKVTEFLVNPRTAQVAVYYESVGQLEL